MRDPVREDDVGGGGTELDPPIRHTYAQGDTNSLSAALSPSRRSEHRDPNATRLSHCARGRAGNIAELHRVGNLITHGTEKLD